jgi:Icc-related predicted phosphoesterase
MHENQGKCKIGKSLVINPGAASERKAAIIELERDKVKSIKFLK